MIKEILKDEMKEINEKINKMEEDINYIKKRLSSTGIPKKERNNSGEGIDSNNYLIFLFESMPSPELFLSFFGIPADGSLFLI